MGIEPTACALQVRCSTTELPRPVQLATFLIRDYITACSIERQADSAYKHAHQRALLPVDSYMVLFYRILPGRESSHLVTGIQGGLDSSYADIRSS